MKELYTYKSNTSKQQGDKLHNTFNNDHNDNYTDCRPSQKTIDFILNFSKALDVQKTSNFDCFIVAN